MFLRFNIFMDIISAFTILIVLVVQIFMGFISSSSIQITGDYAIIIAQSLIYFIGGLTSFLFFWIVIKKGMYLHLTPVYVTEKFLKQFLGFTIPIIDIATYCFRSKTCSNSDIARTSIGFLAEMIFWIYLLFEFYTAYSFCLLLHNKFIAQDGSFISYWEAA